MSFWTLLISFAPWIVFKILCAVPFSDKLLQVKVAILVAALIALYQMKSGQHRGAIMWSGIIFFAFSLVAVVLLSNMWVIKHLGVIAEAVLMGMVWLTMLLRRPFTIEYAKMHVPAEFWQHSRFIRKNYLITSIWGLAFTCGLVAALLRLYHPEYSSAVIEASDDVVLLIAIILTVFMSSTRSKSINK